MRGPIRTLVLVAGTGLVAACYGYTRAQIRMDLPTVLPPLVVVEPGVQVVEDYGEEIFFVDGYYWVRRDGYWYRTSDPYGQWVYVQIREVPPAIIRIPPGRYAHWRREHRGRGWSEGRRSE